MRKLHDRQTGISTTGLLAVLFVAIVAIVIAATSFPSFLVSPNGANQKSATAIQQRADETGAIMALRSIYSAESTYAVSDGQGSYATLSTLSSTALIDQRWAGTGAVNGYQYEVILDSTGNKGFCATAERLSDKMGNYSYAISQQGVIYRLAGDTAPSCDPTTGLISTGTPLGS